MKKRATRAKQYTREFIARAVELADESSAPVAEVARDLGVEYGTLYGWMAKAGKTKKRLDVVAAAPQTEAAMKAELERLRRELEEVKKERDFLKKAAAFFAQEKK
jgi:transposase